MKLKNIALLLFSATIAAAGITYFANRRVYKPTLGNELYKEARLTQEKYRKLKREGKTIDDFTQPSELEEKVKINNESEELNEFYKDPTGDLYLQRASFKKEDTAINTVKNLRKKGFEANYFTKDNWYVVYLGPLNGINDVLVTEDKFYSSYPTKYVLLKGPINTDELKIEREKNLVRLSLINFANCIKKEDDCVYEYISKNYLDDPSQPLNKIFNICDLKKVQLTPLNIDIDLHNYAATVDINYQFKFDCYDSDGIGEEFNRNLNKSEYLKKEGNKYIIQIE